MPSELQAERHDGTLLLTLCGPACGNALSPQACVAGIEALSIAESDPEVRAIVLRGHGAVFCRGLPPREPGSPADAAGAALEDRAYTLIQALQTFPKPVLAAVEGEAAGAGCALALACDLVVAAADARFVLAESAGRALPAAAIDEVVRRLPGAVALRLLWLDEALDATRAHALGLVDTIAPPGSAGSVALQLAARLAKQPAERLRDAKERVRDASGVRPAARETVATRPRQ